MSTSSFRAARCSRAQRPRFAGLFPRIALGSVLLTSSAAAYETDQITDRLVPLRDAAVDADAHVERLFAAAVARTNEQTGCRASPEKTRRRLAENIYDQVAYAKYVRGRGGLQGLGYGSYAAWLETDPALERRSVQYYGSIYARLLPKDSIVLSTVGVCSTILLGGILMGTDKPDHFWAQGYEYFIRSKFGRNDERAVDWGTASERGQYGLSTSGVFSYADLAADWLGYQFYKQLLTDTSPLQRGADGCVTEVRPFRWTDWINDAVDEVMNPPTYTKPVGDAVREQLAGERASLCESYATWGRAVRKRRAAILASDASHVSADAPPRVDEWELDALCEVTE